MGIKNAVSKTIAYAERNGIKAAFYAAMERIKINSSEKYSYRELSEEVLREQNQEYRLLAETGDAVRFSIVVPLFNTPEVYLKQMIDSVVNQSYGNWELVLADASEKSLDVAISAANDDPRIKYYHLDKNAGISHNTNRGLEKATGDYIGLLDHDDILTPDALYEVSRVIKKSMQKNKLSRFIDCPIRLIYSDEDKFEDEKGVRKFFELHEKPSFNMDLLLSNNYICHFAVMRADIIKRLKLRAKFDGAQDFDLFLRCCSEAALSMDMASGHIVHIDKVLYHWRCHRASTAANPASKTYAYEAGQAAIADVLKSNNINGEVVQLPHLGFYRVNYERGILQERDDVACVGGKLVNKKGRVAGGIYKKDKTAPFKNMPVSYSGGLQHRAVLTQDCYAVDIRSMAIDPLYKDIYKDVVGIDYVDTFTDPKADTTALFTGMSEDEIIDKSVRFCEEIKKRGKRVVWDPQIIKRV
ncbi:glycosyltransferase [Butyrivibrio sp. INlla21]|uniref:glycosyltransferase n=1 Tax=Butyrivibrio sp. INlla21 TaxID=1520811 RepID=UPI0008E0D054|nr:glycosyltransferase [Butyrivibrio sp. INlla21]SFU87654.1 Glycosyl transferase family 2 [Butyrivibrio sp. INlla21]